jgi:hypothetical protein
MKHLKSTASKDIDYQITRQAYDRERRQRDALKFLVAAARRDNLSGWEAFFAGHLATTRKRIQRLSAKLYRLRRHLDVAGYS